MALLDKNRATIVQLQHNGNHNITTYMFEEDLTNGTQSNMTLTRIQLIQTTLWQILPAICTSLTCLSFGIMLGWPSPTYPVLLLPESILPISLVQSPMIAGFLMFGTIFSTPFSHHKFYAFKYGIMTALIAITIGWLICWQATNIYHLLISRFTIGLGNGYAMGQIKGYIHGMTKGAMRDVLLKLINVIMVAGILVAYIMGAYLDYYQFALASIGITVVIYFLCYLLPHTPAEYVGFNRSKDARMVLRRLGHLAVDPPGVSQVEASTQNQSIQQILGQPSSRKLIVLIVFLTFFQQFIGAPATIVYCQVIFDNLGVQPILESRFCAICYISTYLVAYLIGTFYIPRFNKRMSLILSCVGAVASLLVLILCIYFGFRHYFKVAAMLAYILTYGVGLATVPNTMVEYMFEKSMRTGAGQCQMMAFCLFAVIITKLFQVFYASFHFYVVFCLFLGVGLVALGFMVIWLPRERLVDAL